MPRINQRGDVVQGLGLVWLTDDLLIGQRPQPDGSWAVSTAPSIDGPWTVIDPRGCNFIAAGGNNWAAFGGSIFGPAAVAGCAIPAGLDGRGAASPDGTIALVKNPGTGQGLLLHRRDGSVLERADIYPTDRTCVINRDQAVGWDARGWMWAVGLPVPQLLPGGLSFAPSVLFTVGRWWIAYHSSDANGYVCHPFDSFDGFRICLPPAFYPNAILLMEPIARFAWSVDAGESPQALRVLDLDLLAPRIPLLPPTPEPPEPQPPDPPDPEPPEPPDPEPPDPIPPEPPEPEPEPLMKQIAYGQPLKDFHPGEVVENGDGTVSVQKPNGQFLCITPEGKVEERPTPGGVWESFVKGSNGLVAYRDLNGQQVCYPVPVVG